MKEVREMIVTPKQAADWLASSPGNPRWKNGKLYDKNKVAAIARDIRNGKWRDPGTHNIGIRIDGTLCEGHHRCAAISEAGIPVKCCVAFGITPEEELHIDDNDKRTIAQRLGTNNTIPSLARIHEGMARKTTVSRVRLSAEEVSQYIENHPLAEIALVLSRAGSSAPIAMKAPVVHAILCAIEYGEKEEAIRKMMKAVNTGFVDGREESAAIVLRNLLLNRKWIQAEAGKLSAIAQAAIYDYIHNIPRTKPYTCKAGKYFEYMVAQGRRGYEISD